MGEQNIKELRKQIRNLVKEILPEILNEEFTRALEKRLIDAVKSRLDTMEERQKDILSTMYRTLQNPIVK